MYAGTTIDDLIGVVSRAEAKVEAERGARVLAAAPRVVSPSIYCVYTFNQFNQLEREYASAGAA